MGIIEKVPSEPEASSNEEAPTPPTPTTPDIFIPGTPDCSINYYRVIRRGMKGDDVADVQRCMNSLGYTSGPVDGQYGSLTYAGITAYQRAQGLKFIDGIVGPETSVALNVLGSVNVANAGNDFGQLGTGITPELMSQHQL